MQLAIVNKNTNIVENIIIPPKGADVYFVPEGYIADYCPDEVSYGWSYDVASKTFTPPPAPAPVPDVPQT